MVVKARKRAGAVVAVEKTIPDIVGLVVIRPLADVTPNTWNPNHMTAFEKDSLRHGLLHDGWLVSQTLLVWGTDEKGRTRNIIIDGEHRWTVAMEMKMPEGPMVFLDGYNEARAKALTLKLRTRQGTHNEVEVGELLRSIQDEFSSAQNLQLEFGIEEEKLMALLSTPVDLELTEKPTGGVIGELPSGQTSHIRMVQLFFNAEQHEEFTRMLKELAVRFSTANATDTVIAAVQRVHANPTS
jgi:hypothetical protein